MAKRILLVDDEIHIIRAAEFKFQRLGYEVFCACDGEEAWTLVKQKRPDVIVTDCQMPRLDGLGLAARVYGNVETMDIPIIMLSAKGFELSPDEIREQFGIVALLPKPFSPRELVRCVEEILEKAVGCQLSAVGEDASRVTLAPKRQRPTANSQQPTADSRSPIADSQQPR